jgi:hypothetical protein
MSWFLVNENIPLGYSMESSHTASKSNQKPTFSFKSGRYIDVVAEQ